MNINTKGITTMKITISENLKTLLNLNDYLMDNFDDYDEYYNAYVCLNDNDILHAKDDFYFNGSANFVIAPKKLIEKYYGFENMFNDKDYINSLSADDFILINQNDGYIYNNDDINELINDIKKEKERLSNE